jgi:hypothetical protein
MFMSLRTLTAPPSSAQSDIKRFGRNPHGALNIPCENCHTSTSWKPIRGVPEFDHNRTKYPLLGMHAKVGCTQCHTSLVFSSAGTHCEDCHADIHRGQFGANCEQCHTVNGWEVHPQELKQHMNRFPLVGMHAMLDCSDCHTGAAVGQFTGLSTACITCHEADFAKATDPDHKASQFPVTCDSCHSADTWFSAKFDHLKYTGYALTGAHATLECTACHINGKFAGTPADCYGCHAKDYNATTAPNHAQAGISTQCQTCHTTIAWIPATFNHNNTSFPLTGAHVNVPCATCHTDNFAGTLPTNCYGCHTKDYNATTNPNHAQSGIPTLCETCHNTTAWSPATFDHNNTSFPLTGAHTTVPCGTCHTDNYAGTLPTNCYGCHTKDYNATATMAGVPNHVNAGFSQTCTQCHTTQTWLNATFNHNATAFPLTGAHTTVPCATCHTDNYAGTLPTNCYGCHSTDYNNTATMTGVPNHVTANFPQDCSQCHSTSSWLNATFNHNNTSFPLTGAHTTVPCATCHTDNYAGTLPTTCYGCHTQDYNNTATMGGGVPNHVTLGYPTDCTVCHTTQTWLNATFNHNNTPFPLQGPHVNVPCTQCHIGGVFAGTPTDCYSCHKADYQGTTNPNHIAAGFPTTCTTCHTTWVTTGWAGATFSHTWFPTNHGGANGVCSTCHTNPNDYSVFVCTNCHTQAQTDPKHSGVKGYVYNSVNCYQCHQNGGGG